MSAPLLEVQGLSVRFGGLTAVKALDLAIEPNQIFAVIGPNGAGKTTFFNAVTGIHEPTEGVVRFEGKDTRSPLAARHYFWWALLGITVGLVTLLLVSSVDYLWAAVVKQNYHGPASGFSLRKAGRDFVEYLAAAPRVEVRTGRFYVITADGRTPFGSVGKLEEALARRDSLRALMRLTGPAVIDEAGGGSFRVLAGAGGRVLLETPTRAAAEEQLKVAAEVRKAAASSRRWRLISFFVGGLVGAAGGFAIWRQTRRTPTSVAALGMARTFQNIRLFQEMTVVENVLVGMDRRMSGRAAWHSFSRYGLLVLPAGPVVLLALLSASLRFDWFPQALNTLVLGSCFAGTVALIARFELLGAFSRADLRQEQDARGQALVLLKLVGLEARAQDLARNLAYGDQRRLELARALATQPKLLLLDEPAAGMNPTETGALMPLIRKIRDRGTTVLLIEHHMRVVMAISDRIAVLDYGEKIAEGTPEEIRSHPRVVEAYLGKEDLS